MTARLAPPHPTHPVITVARSSLRTALAKLMALVDAGKQTVPVAQHVLIEARDGRLTFTATNFDAFARLSIPCELHGEGVVLLPARLLAEIVASLPAVGAVTLTLETPHAVISAGRSRFDVRGLLPDEFPEMPEVNADRRDGRIGSVAVDAATFLDAIARCVNHASDEPVRTALNAVLLERQGDQLLAIACDVPTLARVHAGIVHGDGFRTACSVQRQGVPVLVRMFADLDEHATLTLTTDGARLRAEAEDGTRAQVRLVSEPFPPYQGILVEQRTHRVVCDRALFAAALKRVGLTADETRAIELTFADEITIRAGKADVGKGVDVVPVELHERPEGNAGPAEYSCFVNTTKLVGALATIGADSVELTTDGPGRPLFLRDTARAADDPTLVAVMPLANR